MSRRPSGPSPQRKAALERRLANKKQRMQQKLAQRRQQLAARRPPASRAPRVGIALLMLAMVLLFLLLCRCGDGPVEGAPAAEPDDPVVPEVDEPPEVPPVTAVPPPLSGHIDRRDRPRFEGKTPERLPWLSAFRLQVSARSVRLATCFVGIDAPGAMKWTTLVDPSEGTVAEHELEPVLLTRALSRDERECVLGVLTRPPYALDFDGASVTPARVSLVIEF